MKFSELVMAIIAGFLGLFMYFLPMILFVFLCIGLYKMLFG